MAWLTFVYICAYHALTAALIPAAAYCVMTPVIIYRHPQPSRFDVSLVGIGYFYYCILLMATGAVRAFLSK